MSVCALANPAGAQISLVIYTYLLQVNVNKQIVEDKQDKEDQKSVETKTEPKPDKKENDKKESAPDKTDDSDMTGKYYSPYSSIE